MLRAERLREELRPERSLDPKVLCALEFSCVCVLCVHARVS